MIKQKLIKKYYKEVNEAIIEAFDFAIKNERNPKDFLLFLENGHKTDIKMDGFSDFVIGQGLKGIADWDRMNFFDFYVNLPFEKAFNLARKKENKKTVYKNSLHLDLMIYTHFWESYPNLRTMKQLANIVSNEYFEWDIQVPDFTRHTFIRKEIRDKLTNKGLKLGEIISRSYHSQLRNAFSHSDYSFFKTGFIELNNYKGEAWEMKEISYDDWDERFTLTVLLFNLLTRNILEYKRKLGNSKMLLGVWIPYSDGFKLRYLWYDKYWNRFICETSKPAGSA